MNRGPGYSKEVRERAVRLVRKRCRIFSCNCVVRDVFLVIRLVGVWRLIF